MWLILPYVRETAPNFVAISNVDIDAPSFATRFALRSLDRAKSRLESSTKKITQIETLVKSATGDLKNVAADRAQNSSDILSLKRGKLLTEARSLSSLRGERGSAETSESNENENNKGKKDTTYMPKHIRASYERDVDKLNHAFRVSGNIQREMRSAGR